MEKEVQNEETEKELEGGGGDTCGGVAKPPAEEGHGWVCVDNVWTKVAV